MDTNEVVEVANESLNSVMDERDALAQRLARTEEQLRIATSQATTYRNALLQLAKEININM